MPATSGYGIECPESGRRVGPSAPTVRAGNAPAAIGALTDQRRDKVVREGVAPIVRRRGLVVDVEHARDCLLLEPLPGIARVDSGACSELEGGAAGPPSRRAR